MRKKHFMPDECKFCCKAWERGCNGVWDYKHCDIYNTEKERIQQREAERRKFIESFKRYAGL